MRPRGWAGVLAFCASAGVAEPRFEPVDLPSHVYDGGWAHFVGGGVAAFDCSGDGLPELFAAGGEHPAILLENRSRPGGAIAFGAITPQALTLTGVIGAYPLDIDSDGLLDLVVLRVGENLLLRGEADCGFAPFERLGFVSPSKWTTAFSATWEAGQVLPTLAFGNYVNRADPGGPFRACDSHELYRPTGGRYGPPLPLAPGHCALSMLFSDWGRSGRNDLRISNDRHYYVDQGQEQMWAMGAPLRLYDQSDGWQDHKLWGMGIAARDLDRDGTPEVFLSSMGDQRLQRLVGPPGAPHFEDVPFAWGTTAHRPYLGGDGRPSTGWQVAFGDVQNDGRDDIFITKGNVDQMPDSAMDDPNNLLIQTADGRFVERGGVAGLASLHRGRGAVLVDLNADGLLDIAVVNRRAAMEVWQNVTSPAGDWIEVSVMQDAPNTGAVGAWIEVDSGGEVQSQQVTVGGGHASGAAVGAHFGLGASGAVRVRIRWPDGVVSGWADVATGQRVQAVRNGPTVVVRPY